MKTFCKNLLEKIKNIKITKKQVLVTVCIIAVLLSAVVIFYFIEKNKKPKLNPYVAPPTPTVTKFTPTVTKEATTISDTADKNPLPSKPTAKKKK